MLQFNCVNKGNESDGIFLDLTGLLHPSVLALESWQKEGTHFSDGIMTPIILLTPGVNHTGQFPIVC